MSLWGVFYLVDMEELEPGRVSFARAKHKGTVQIQAVPEV